MGKIPESTREKKAPEMESFQGGLGESEKVDVQGLEILFI